MQADNRKVDIHIIDVNNVRLLYESSNKEYNAAINIAKMADDSSTELGEEEARKEGVIAGIRAMANAYFEIRNTIVSNYLNMPSSTEAELREEYSKQGNNKGLSIALKVSPLIGTSKATYRVSIDTLFRHYGNLNTAVARIVDILKQNVEKNEMQ
ncbi:MAG: hypothetical protein ACP5MZ_00860 [Candidatus Micrarchaeia archaeon]